MSRNLVRGFITGLSLLLLVRPSIGQLNVRTPEPLLVDVNGDGYELTTVADGVVFDLAGNGRPQRVAWTAAGSDDAFLALDENHNGRIDDGHELIGAGATGPPNGFAMLAVLDGFASPADLEHAQNRRPDGLLTAADAIFHRLLLWRDINHNGVSEENEIESLEHAGVVTLYLGYEGIELYDSHGNLFHYRSTALFRNSAGVDVARPITSVRLLSLK